MDSLFEGEEPPLEKVRAVSSDMTVHYRALSASSDKMRRSGDGNDDFPGARLSSSDRRRGSSGGAGGDKAQMLVWSFCAMVVIGLGNKIFQKLETIPMYNYPNFLNLLTTAAYIPLSFAYVVPATRKGWIREDNFTVPKKDFAVMGFLDSVAGIMQVFAATYLPGSLLVLLLQSAIPVSMALSRGILKTRYHTMQYASAVVVMAGIVIVLAPSLFGASDDDDESGDTTVIWGLVLIASCVPMCLSSIYKEMSLGEVDLDPIYLNAWIAVFQFLFSIPLAIPAALAGSPSLYPSELPGNLWDGLRCYVGISSAKADGDDDEAHADDCNPQAPLFVNIYLIFNVGYNILIIMILKFGNANILWLAMTVMVPLGNLAFALPFMPQSTDVTPYDMAGLVVIMAGLVGYKQGPVACKDTCPMPPEEEDGEEEDGEGTKGSYAGLSLSAEVDNPITWDDDAHQADQRKRSLLQHQAD